MLVYAGVVLAAFLLAVVLGWLLIPVLRRLKVGQIIRDVGPQSHLTKAGIPTMGGLIFALAGAAVAVAFMPSNSWGYIVLIMALAYGSIGFADDYLKVVLKRPLGLKARHKLIGQFAFAFAFYLVLRWLGNDHSLMVPGLGSVNLAWGYPIFVAVFMVGTTNAVNLADGVDGLAGGLATITLVGFAIIGWLAKLEGVTYVSAALVGGILGYLVFNLHPAKVIMGDTGSLAIGGAVGTLAVITRTELLFLVLLGIVFVLETASVIIQVTYFRLTGRRVFLMAPIHHHFELKGWGEWKVCFWFWAIQTLGAILAIAVWLIAY